MPKLRGGVTLGGFDDIDQVMRRDGQRGGIGLGGADIHVAIHQRGIDADDFQREPLHQLHRDTSFAAGGGAHEENGWRRVVRVCRHGFGGM